MSQIVDVWASNLEAEMYRISKVYKKYPIIVFDTEFPGTVNTTEGLTDFERQPYDYVKTNIDQTKLIQIGMTFMSKKGTFPTTSTWQFNFKFDLDHDNHCPESIELLKAAEINFDNLRDHGIPHELFGYYMVSSGLVSNPNVYWVAFHGSSDFAYLSKSITGYNLPTTFDDYSTNLRAQFPHAFDVKYIKSIKGWKGGLQRLGFELGLTRVGTTHQAGSDALLTARAFGVIMEDMKGVDAMDNVDGYVFGYESDTRKMI